MTPGFWHGKRVLLTGHTGFKGSWLALWLHRLGAQVIGFSLEPPTRPNLFDMARVGEHLIDLRGDLRDLGAVSAAVHAHRPEIVVHMAAQALVRAAYAEPVETYATNVMGTVHVLEAVRRVGAVRAVLVVTTDKCYENREWHWGYRENDAMGGRDPYSSSKGCAELVAAAYRASFLHDGVAVATARAGNVIGGGDWAQDRLLPDLVGGALDGRVVRIRNPDAIRPWQHVLEPLAGYLTLAERLYGDGEAFAEGWNFGPTDDDARPVGWMADRMMALWPDLRWEKDVAMHPHEAQYLKLDCSKARARLGWRPRLPLVDALAWTAHWYRSCQSGADMRVLTEQQITSYQELTKDGA